MGDTFASLGRVAAGDSRRALMRFGFALRFHDYASERPDPAAGPSE